MLAYRDRNFDSGSNVDKLFLYVVIDSLIMDNSLKFDVI